MVSINAKLLQLANQYYISHGSAEQKKIDASVDNLKRQLRLHFAGNVSNIVEFGSYKRDTILPRQFDNLSDVDLMIFFNHASLQVNPGTYRNYLVRFSEERYSRSSVYKSSPTVVLELEHIKYDLVPAYEETKVWTTVKTIYIPKNDSAWMATDPHGFNSELTRVNTQYGSNIKKVIRLLKAWNAKVGYPIESFGLEKEIAGMTFWFCNSLEEYFFKTIENLSVYRDGNFFTQNQKVSALKDNANRVKAALQADNIYSANLWLAHILPIN